MGGEREVNRCVGMKGDTNNLYILGAVTLYKVVFKNVSNAGF